MMTVKVEGLAALGQQLEALGRDMSTKILRQAGRAALAPVQDDMRQHAGFDGASHDPHMRDSITLRSTTRGRAQLTLRVGPGKKHRIKALAQEFGTVKQVAHRFIGPAMEYQTSHVLRLLAAEIRRGIENR